MSSRGGLALLALGVFLAPDCASGTTVYVMSLAPGRADIVVNGTAVRQLREGQTSPEGVTLEKSDGKQAVFQYDGKTYAFGIGGTNSPSVALQADARGHFFATVYINGVPVRAVVDTGASVVSLNWTDASRMGIDLAQAQRGRMNTANGTIPVWRVMLASVQLGEILVRNVEASVSEGGAEQSAIVLLGNSFLQQLELQRSGSTLTLTKRY